MKRPDPHGMPMLRLSLAVILMVTQSTQAFAVPIYLCVAPDGSLAVDLGPDACQCRGDADHGDTVCGEMAHEHPACERHEPACCNACESQASDFAATPETGAADEGLVGQPACECNHVPVSGAAAQVISRSRSTVRVLVAWIGTGAALPAHSADRVTERDVHSNRERPPSSSGSASVLKTIVLRC